MEKKEKKPPGEEKNMENYKILEHRFPSAGGRQQVYGVAYVPDRPRGMVQIAHGMAEHMGRYREFMDFLAKNGYIAFGCDHMGHGKTARTKEELGYFAPKKGFDLLVTDLHLMTIYMQGKYPGMPAFFLGHSMGSFALRLYLTRYGKELQGAILSGTGGKQAGAGLMGALCQKGGGSPNRLVDRLAFGNFNRGIENPRTPFDWLSRDEERVADYITDPLCGFTFTTKGFGDLFSAIARANRRETFRQTPDLPLLLISGDKDPVGAYGKGVRQVAENYRRAGLHHVECKLYPGARHEVLNETNREQVYQDVLRFLPA